MSGQDSARAARASTDGGADLTTVVEFLPTPLAHDAKGGKTAEQVDAMRERTGAGVSNLVEVAEALLPTPVRSDAESARNATSTRPAGSRHHSGETLHDVFLPTPTVALAEGGQTTRGGDRVGEPLLAGIVEHMLPTPLQDPAAANGHARDLSSELLPTPTRTNADGNGFNDRGDLLLPGVAEAVALLPTPAASQMNDSEEAEHWQARYDHHAAKDNPTRAGMPLPIAVQVRGDGPEDDTDDGETVVWGKYRQAILRAQAVAQRLAPSPTRNDGKGGKRRLAPRFVEWMMLLTSGHVTEVPGISRRDQLKMLGNGVVPLQASAATVILLARVRARLAESQAVEDRT